MIKVDYDPILGCTGWDFQSPTIDIKKLIYKLQLKINRLKNRPTNYGNKH